MDPFKEHKERMRQSLDLVNPLNFNGSCVLQLAKGGLIGAGFGIIFAERKIALEGEAWVRDYKLKHGSNPRYLQLKEYTKSTSNLLTKNNEF